MEPNPPKKTTLLIPEELWLRAKRHALDERTNLRKLLLEGLELRIQLGEREQKKFRDRNADLARRFHPRGKGTKEDKP
jgi:hypothetical protein